MPHTFKDMRIGLPILVGNLIMLALLGVVAFSGVTGMQRVAQSNASALERRSEMADLRMLQIYLKTMDNNRISYIDKGDPVDAQAFRNAIAPLREFRQKIRTTIETEDERLNLNIIDRQADEYIALFVDQIIPARERNDTAALEGLAEQSSELSSQLDPFIQNMIAEYETKSEKADQMAQETKTQTTLIVIGLSIVTVAVGLATGFYLARMISNSTQQIIQTSEMLRKSEQALKDSENLLSSIFEHIPNMVFVKEAAGLSYVRMNRAVESLLGITRQNCIGRTDEEIFPHAIAANFNTSDQETLRSGRLVEIADETIESKAKGRRVLYTQKIPILDEDGKPKYLMGISEDITERKRADDQIRELNAELEKRVIQRTAQLEMSNRELESFAHAVSHDLRAPLRAMEGFSNVLMEEYGGALGEEGIHYLRRIRINAVRMAKLLDDLLDLSRITRREVHRKKVDLALLAEGIMMRLQSEQPDRRLEFTRPASLIAHADPYMISIAIANLLENAWKYTRYRPLTRIDFTSTVKSGQEIYAIRDNGAGFDMAYVHQVFKAFQRMSTDEDIIGSGVGLAMAQRIIQRHGGRIWAEGEVDKGAAFFFTLE